MTLGQMVTLRMEFDSTAPASDPAGTLNSATTAMLHLDILAVSEFQENNPGRLVSPLWVEAHLSPLARESVKRFRAKSPQSWVDLQTDPTFLIRVLLEALWMHTYPGSLRWGVLS